MLQSCKWGREETVYGRGEGTCVLFLACKWEARHAGEKAMLCGVLGNGLLGLRNWLKNGLKKNGLKEK